MDTGLRLLRIIGSLALLGLLVLLAGAVLDAAKSAVANH